MNAEIEVTYPPHWQNVFTPLIIKLGTWDATPIENMKFERRLFTSVVLALNL